MLKFALVLALTLLTACIHRQSPKPLDELQKLEVNGNSQWLLLRGRADRPILFFIHGGPGAPLMQFSRAYDQRLIEEFLVVHWDQRLTGKSYEPSVPIESYNIDQIASDGVLVAQYLRTRFPGSKLILVGHSWGTHVGSHMAKRRPDLFSSYVSVGTTADYLKTNLMKFDFLRRKINDSGSAVDRKALIELGPPPWPRFQQLVILSRLMGKYGGHFHSISAKDIDTAVEMNREYSADERKNINIAMEKIWTQITPYMQTYKASEAVPKLTLPVIFVHGTFDMATPLSLAKEYYEKLEAPHGKRWIEFPNSAHFPMFEEPERFLEVMRDASQL